MWPWKSSSNIELADRKGIALLCYGMRGVGHSADVS